MTESSLFFVLVIALAIGWLMGRHQYKAKQKKGSVLPSLDMLATESQSETMQAILSMAERQEAVELQLNLGTFYRRRGEIDKAISIHQNLFARPGLDKKLASQVQLALASDYLQAGLFDRAERLLLELLKSHSHLKAQVLKKLITLYEEEKNWAGILKLEKDAKALKEHKSLAYACCELAEQAMLKQNWWEASANIQQALKFDSKCIRALLLEAKMADMEGFPKKVLVSLKEALQYQPSILQVILPELQRHFDARHRPQELEKLLQHMWLHHPMPLSLHGYAHHLALSDQLDASIEQLTHSLSSMPTLEGFSLLLEKLMEKGEDLPFSYLENFKHVLDLLSDQTDDYQCQACGFEAHAHQWRCPSCKQWETFIPKLAHVAVSKPENQDTRNQYAR